MRADAPSDDRMGWSQPIPNSAFRTGRGTIGACLQVDPTTARVAVRPMTVSAARATHGSAARRVPALV